MRERDLMPRKNQESIFGGLRIEGDYTIEEILQGWRSAKTKAEPKRAWLKRLKSPYRGVSWNSRGYGWVVRVKVHGRSITLGFFAEGLERDAAACYDLCQVHRYGRHATLNFPDRRKEYREELQERPPDWLDAVERGVPKRFIQDAPRG